MRLFAGSPGLLCNPLDREVQPGHFGDACGPGCPQFFYLHSSPAFAGIQCRGGTALRLFAGSPGLPCNPLGREVQPGVLWDALRPVVPPLQCKAVRHSAAGALGQDTLRDRDREMISAHIYIYLVPPPSRGSLCDPLTVWAA